MCSYMEVSEHASFGSGLEKNVQWIVFILRYAITVREQRTQWSILVVSMQCHSLHVNDKVLVPQVH